MESMLLPPTSVFRHGRSAILVNIGWYPKVASYDLLGEQPHYSTLGEAWNDPFSIHIDPYFAGCTSKGSDNSSNFDAPPLAQRPCQSNTITPLSCYNRDVS